MSYTKRRRKQNPDWYTVSEVAQQFSVARGTVYRWIQTGILKAHESRSTGQLLVHERDVQKFEREQEA